MIQDYSAADSCLHRRIRRSCLLRPSGCGLRSAFGKGHSDCAALLRDHRRSQSRKGYSSATDFACLIFSTVPKPCANRWLPAPCPRSCSRRLTRRKLHWKSRWLRFVRVWPGWIQRLVDSATNAASKMQHQLSQLRAKAARAELRQTEVLSRNAEYSAICCIPARLCRNARLAGVYFVARYGAEFLRDVYEAIHPDCLDHQVITM